VKKVKTAAVVSHGCKLNQFEGESIEYSLEQCGFRIIDLCDRPDVIVVNTCTVTNRGDRKSRNSIMRAARLLGEEGLLVVTGCYAQTDRDALQRIRGVGLVVGQEDKSSIPYILGEHFENRIFSPDAKKGPFGFSEPENSHRSRVFVKVQDGCDGQCAYCKVPLARGSSRSRDYRDVLHALNRLFEKGYREAVLTGVNLGSYRFDDMCLPELLDFLLRETPEKLRIRLSSIEPDCFDHKLFDMIAHERIVPHFHIPLQSGSDRVLERMKRPYRIIQYLDVVDRLRKVKADSHLGTDIIVGFPGEDEDDFQKTVSEVHRIRFASLHVFRYSVRNGTAAARMIDGVPQSVKRKRSTMLIELGGNLNYLFRKGFEGTVRPAVLEPYGNTYVGITDNYIRVTLKGMWQGLDRTCVPLHISSVTEDSTTGELLP